VLAADLADFFVKINGRELAGFGRISVDAPKLETVVQTRRQKLLAAVSDPNIAMLLMSIGAAGIFIELYNPGLILPGVVGAVSLLLVFILSRRCRRIWPACF